MEIVKIAALAFLVVSVLSFGIYFLSPIIFNAILGDVMQDPCGSEAVKAYESCIAMQKSGLLIGCIPPLCPYVRQLSVAAGSVFSFISACCGVYGLYSGRAGKA